MIVAGMVGWRNPSRYVAILALAATIAVTYAIVHHGFLAKSTTTTATSAVQQLTGLHTAKSKAKSNAAPTFYVVQPNDTLSKISARTGVPIAVLQSLNPTINPNAIQPSQRLRLRR